MFICVVCKGSFVLEDVKVGRYFPSTGACLSCYQRMNKSKETCFGDEFDPKALACQVCPDRVVCRVFVQHPKDSMRER